MIYPKIVAIDGPAASGKTTIANKLAERWGYLFLDTGVMYRAVTWLAMYKNISTKDEPAVSKLADEVQIDVAPPSIDDGREYDVLADGIDVTWKIRTQKVDSKVSRVSTYPGVRQALTKQQRRIGLNGSVIMVGRDIGTVVLPEADLKIFLDASVDERARRRYNQRIDRGEEADLLKILKNLTKRDRIDSSREIAPLRAASDAVVINTDNLSVSEVVLQIEKIALEILKD
ncbi:MAG: (d)CMP kinase [Anaerolineales bacterium]|jgi:cytidylate kinase|nr:(d)CMP kinase [Anaerolineales bacterium]